MRLTEQVHHDIQKVLRSGDIAIDATAGNGHDTLFLAQQVAPHGQVFAFDIQDTALEQTTQRIQQHQLNDVVHLHLASHADMAAYIPSDVHGAIRVVMFNLGYLPGTEHDIQTQATDTTQALEQAAKILAVGGIISILAYTGHAGGREEADRVQTWVDAQSEHFDIRHIIPQNTRKSPPEYIYMQKTSITPMAIPHL